MLQPNTLPIKIIQSPIKIPFVKNIKKFYWRVGSGISLFFVLLSLSIFPMPSLGLENPNSNLPNSNLFDNQTLENQTQKNPNEDEKQPIKITSDKAEFNDKLGTAHYFGNVFVQQGTRELHSDTLFIKRDHQGNIDHIVATGDPARFKALPNSEQSLAEGRANTVKYFPKENKILLIEKAELSQKGDVIQGEFLTYYLDTQTLSSKALDNQRTTVILHSKSSIVPKENPQNPNTLKSEKFDSSKERKPHE